MRNPNRIRPFLSTLEKAWNKHPDWRFGQLMSNFFNCLDIDPFFLEEEDMEKRLIDFFELNEEDKKKRE